MPHSIIKSAHFMFFKKVSSITKIDKLLKTKLQAVEIITTDIVKSSITNRRANCYIKATLDLMKNEVTKDY